MYKLNQELFDEYQYDKITKNVYGVDLFIGEPDYWGQGIGTSIMKIITQYLFNKKQAYSIILDPHIDNSRAIRCYEKVGFKIIKKLPKHELHNGKMVDCYLMEYKK